MDTWGHGDMDTWTTTNILPEECLDGGEKFEKFEKFEISRLELSRVFKNQCSPNGSFAAVKPSNGRDITAARRVLTRCIGYLEGPCVATH